MFVQISVPVPAFSPLVRISRTGSAGSNPTFNHRRICYTVLHSGCTVSPIGFPALCDPFHVLTTASMEGIVTIVGLKPETTYAVRLAALNGKGLGEISAASEFKTQPVRKYSLLPGSSPWAGGDPSSVQMTAFCLYRSLCSRRSHLLVLWPSAAAHAIPSVLTFSKGLVTQSNSCSSLLEEQPGQKTTHACC